MPLLERPQDVHISHAALTDVARDYNNNRTWNINLGNQGGSDPLTTRRDDLGDMPVEQCPSDIYARLLLPKKQGYPLWFPEPDEDLPPEYRSIGVDVGDVGTITSDGAFAFLFNICRSADDPVNLNWLGVPEGFTPLTLQPGDIRRVSKMYDTGTHIASAHICKVQLREEESAGTSATRFNFECSGSAGAVLMLPEGGSRAELRRRGIFYQYAARNATAWYQFANGPDLCRQIGNGSLYLITGCDKSPAWGVASYSNPFGAPEVSLKFTAVVEGEDGGSSPLAYSWENYSSAIVRTGRQQIQESEVGLSRPSTSNKVGVEHAFSSPCEMKSNMTSTLLKSLPNFLSLPAHVHSSYGRQSSNKNLDSANENDVLLEHISQANVSEPYHPLVTINNHLLESVEGSMIAITHDDDWHALLDVLDCEIPRDSELIGRLRMENVRQDGACVYLEYAEDGLTPQTPQDHYGSGPGNVMEGQEPLEHRWIENQQPKNLQYGSSYHSSASLAIEERPLVPPTPNITISGEIVTDSGKINMVTKRADPSITPSSGSFRGVDIPAFPGRRTSPSSKADIKVSRITQKLRELQKANNIETIFIRPAGSEALSEFTNELVDKAFEKTSQ